jgi:hypothetical protein
MALGLTQPLTEMSTRNTSWGMKAAGAWGWQPYNLHVANVLKSGSLNLLETSGPPQACNGIAFSLFVFNLSAFLMFLCSCICLHSYLYFAFFKTILIKPNRYFFCLNFIIISYPAHQQIRRIIDSNSFSILSPVSLSFFYLLSSGSIPCPLFSRISPCTFIFLSRIFSKLVA